MLKDSYFFFKKKFKLIYFARGFYFNDSQNYFKWLFSYFIECILLFATDAIMSQSQKDLDKTNFLLKVMKIKSTWVGSGVSQDIFIPKDNVIYSDKIIFSFSLICK